MTSFKTWKFWRTGRITFFSIDSKFAEQARHTARFHRSKSIRGPYVDKNGTDMKNGGASVIDSGNSAWAGPGGQDIEGISIIARQAYSTAENGAPKLLISDLYWDSSGWPYYN
ncbi:hypothetical protein CPT76_01225 [Paenibacillus sp. AR247]|nr:hypothetical protein CPT76_01225 [Paenibacillus sp. AR247]